MRVGRRQTRNNRCFNWTFTIQANCRCKAHCELTCILISQCHVLRIWHFLVHSTSTSSFASTTKTILAVDAQQKHVAKIWPYQTSGKSMRGASGAAADVADERQQGHPAILPRGRLRGRGRARSAGVVQ
eukprot:3792737-Pyramimonas_sp.AAC.1